MEQERANREGKYSGECGLQVNYLGKIRKPGEPYC